MRKCGCKLREPLPEAERRQLITAYRVVDGIHEADCVMEILKGLMWPLFDEVGIGRKELRRAGEPIKAPQSDAVCDLLLDGVRKLLCHLWIDHDAYHAWHGYEFLNLYLDVGNDPPVPSSPRSP